MINLLRRANSVPPALRRSLDAHERVLAVADLTDQVSVVVATQLGLWVPDGSSWRRVGWHEIVKATWTDDGLDVIAATIDQDSIVEDGSPMLLRLAEPRSLPAVVRKRVEGSIGRWEQVRVPGGTGRVVARRVPGRDGLLWTARIDSGTPDSPAARLALRGYLQQILASSAEIEGESGAGDLGVPDPG